MKPEFAPLLAAVQRNCHIADARHARGMTLCTYLLAMREFYRWEAGIAPGAPLERGAVGAWLSAREALWETLGDAEFVALPIDGRAYEPFDVAAINRQLLPHGLVYGAGIGRFGRPHFFLAALLRRERFEGLEALISGREYARDLGALPAALQGDVIFVRREALRQWLWEKVEAWQMKREPPGALQAALAAYGLTGEPRAALERMVDGEIETLILHERGEHLAGKRLGAAWEERLACGCQRRSELLLRAVRDNLADCLVTLPALIERAAWPSVLFWLANLDGMRRELLPACAELDAQKVGAGEAARALQTLAARGAEHFERLARRLLKLSDAEIAAASQDLSALALTRSG
jgi:hypothetical protein